MKSFLLAIFIICSTMPVFAQKNISDGTITYSVSVTNGKTEPGIADAFDGASLVVYMKGNLVRSDFKSILRLQSIIFDGSDGSAVMLKESGKEKYMTNFDKGQWAKYNKKYDGITFAYEAETKNIAGIQCKKAVGTLKDGSKVEVFYAPDLVPLAQGYEYVFKDLAGLPLEYQVTTASVTVKYTASAIQTAPVSAAKFEKPKAGYKILDFN